MASRTFSQIMRKRVTVLQGHAPDDWATMTAIAFQVGRAMGRPYHSYKAQRVLDGLRINLDRNEAAGWIEATEDAVDLLDPDEREDYDEAASWGAAGILPPDFTIEDVRRLLDEREAAVIAGDSEFAARQAARRTRRRRRGTPPGTAATAITAAATLAATWLTHRAGGTHTTDLALAAATLSGERAAPQVTAIPWWAPADADAEERWAA